MLADPRPPARFNGEDAWYRIRVGIVTRQCTRRWRLLYPIANLALSYESQWPKTVSSDAYENLHHKGSYRFLPGQGKSPAIGYCCCGVLWWFNCDCRRNGRSWKSLLSLAVHCPGDDLIQVSMRTHHVTT